MNLQSDYVHRQEAQELIEDIYKFKRAKCPEFSLINAILSYSEEFDVPLIDIGNTLADHTEFVKIFEKQLIREKYIKGTLIYDNGVDEGEW